MLRTSADRLHGAPHVPALRQQVPPGRNESIGIDTSALVALLAACRARRRRGRRGQITSPSPSDDGMRAAELLRFLWIQRGVDPAEHDGRAPGSGVAARFRSREAHCPCGSRCRRRHRPARRRIERLQCFIGDLRPAMGCRRGSGEDEQPTRRDDADSERQMARIHQMDSHICSFTSAGVTRQAVGDREAVSEMSTYCCPQTSRPPPLQN